QAAVARVMESGWYVLGREGEAFERRLAAYHGPGECVGVASGSDAGGLALRAAGGGPGGAGNTRAPAALSTLWAGERAGATPGLVDIDPETYTIAPDAARAPITPRTAAVVATHVYGHPADLRALVPLCERSGLLLIEDCAQAPGATSGGRKIGTFGRAA